MTFLNFALLGGIAAFAVPLIIHLLNKSKYQSLDWGAMQFLEQAVKVNSRRFRWQTWLLLLVRCLIPIILAICMARPWISTSKNAAGWMQRAPQASTLIIDNSFSMMAPANPEDFSSPTAWQLAQKHAMQILDKKPSNAVFSILPNSNPVTSKSSTSTRDTKRLAEHLDGLKANAGQFHLSQAIEDAISSITLSNEPQKSIVVISDFQQSMLESIDSNAMESIKRRLASTEPAIQLSFLPVESRPDPTDKSDSTSLENVSVHVDPSTQSITGVMQPWELKLRFKNYGKKDTKQTLVTVYVDDKPLLSKRINLSSGSESQLAATFSFETTGSHRVQARIEADDPVQSDNRVDWSVASIGSIPVLILDTKANQPSLFPDSDFLQIALSPETANQGFELGKRPSANRFFQMESKTPDQCKTEDIVNQQAIILVNVPELRQELTSAIVAYVEKGGILLVFAGDAIKPTWYNESLGKVFSRSGRIGAIEEEQSKRPFLPYLYSETPTLIGEREQGVGLRRDAFQHPAVQILKDSRWGTLDTLEFRGWYTMLPNEAIASENLSDARSERDAMKMGVNQFSSNQYLSTRNRSKFIAAPGENGSEDDLNVSLTLLSLANGSPLMAERRFGQGTIIQYATTCDDRWTNWPLRPVFLPMMHQAILTATPPFQWQINVQTGQILTIPNTSMLDWMVQGSQGNDLPRLRKQSSDKIENREPTSSSDILKTPLSDQSQSNLQLVQWRMPLEQTAIQPIDQITHRDSTTPTAGLPSVLANYPGTYSLENLAPFPLFFAAQAPLNESNLIRAKATDIRSIAEAMGASVLGNGEDFYQLQTGSGREVWKWFLIALLVFLFGEIFLQSRMSRGAA